VRTTLNIDDDLLDRASALTGIIEKTALVRESLRALIERETGRRLAKLGGSDAAAKAAPRRRLRRSER
jgi:Arc/MetJ family transcription regulator